MALTFIQIGFALLGFISVGLLYLEIRKAVNTSQYLITSRFLPIASIGIIGWILFVSSWSLSGVMGDFSMFPFNVILVLIIPFLSILYFTLSRIGKEILLRIPVEKIIQLNAFRIVVELLLWALYLENLAPIQMTFEGRNLDVLIGLSAPVIAFLYSKGKITKTGLMGWNLLCLGLLINIVVTAILSMPTPMRVFMNEPSNTIVTQFPISWLPGLLVPLAYALHFFSIRQLSIKGDKKLMT